MTHNYPCLKRSCFVIIGNKWKRYSININEPYHFTLYILEETQLDKILIHNKKLIIMIYILTKSVYLNFGYIWRVMFKYIVLLPVIWWKHHLFHLKYFIVQSQPYQLILFHLIYLNQHLELIMPHQVIWSNQHLYHLKHS